MKTLLSAEAISARVRALGAQITRDYAGKDLVLVAVLKGGFVFAADLARAIDLPLRLEFLGATSYGDGTASSGDLRVAFAPEGPMTGLDVLLVEDIVDTGRTAARLLELLRERRPASLKLCALLHKPARAEIPVDIDYRGFEIGDVFVVGYGLDLAGLHRNLPFVAIPSSS